MSPEEALSLIISCHMSLHSLLRKTPEKHDHKLCLNYNRVRNAVKNAAYPEGISASEEKCAVELSTDAYRFQDHHHSGETLWSNPRVPFPRFCRPILQQWTRETEVITKEEERFLKRKIQILEPVEVNGN